MIRFIIIALFVVIYLVLGIPVLLVEMLIGKFSRRAKGLQLPAPCAGGL